MEEDQPKKTWNSTRQETTGSYSPLTTSPIELIAAFESGFTGLKPEDVPQLPLAERLDVFREHIVARRKSGYSWEQIAQALRHPNIGIAISPQTLRRLISEKPRTVKRTPKGITKLRVLPPESQPDAGAK